MAGSSKRVPEQPLFGRRLRALREAQGISQAQLAGEEFSAAYLSRLESGARPPTPRVLAHLCERLGVGLGAFSESASSPLALALARVAADGYAGDTTELLAAALAADEGGDASSRWQALWLLADGHRAARRSAEELHTLHELTAVSDDIDLPDLRVRSRVRLARRQRAAGDLIAAHQLVDEALVISAEAELPRAQVVEVLLVQASIDADSGRLPKARERIDKLVSPVEDGLPLRLETELLWTAATVLTRQGEQAGAARLLERALTRLTSWDDLVLWMRLRLAAASLYLQMNPRDTDRAQVRLSEAAPAVQLLGIALHQIEFRILECQLALHQGRLDDAARLSAELDELPDGVGVRDQLRLGVIRHQLRILRNEDRDAAVRELERIAQEAQATSDLELSAEVWRSLAEVLRFGGSTRQGAAAG